jgi:hypothetical protein
MSLTAFQKHIGDRRHCTPGHALVLRWDARRDDSGPLCLRRHDRRTNCPIRAMERQKISSRRSRRRVFQTRDRGLAGSPDWRVGVRLGPRRAGAIPQAVDDP